MADEAHNISDRKRRPMVAGERYGNLVSVERSRRWLFRCDCGRLTVVEPASVRKGNTRSCGQCRPNPFLTHGHTVGGSASPEWRCWRSMRERCNYPHHPHYHRYGGRGITVCERWQNSFEAFLADVGPRPHGRSLDRINNDGNYEPGNVQWATRKEQARNRECVPKVFFQGREMSLPEAAELSGVSLLKVRNRLARGWDMDRALTPGVSRK